MNMSEFKAWFEGFSEVITVAPNPQQWARIKQRLAQVDGVPTTYPVYLREYGYPVGREWWVYPSLSPTVTCGSTGSFVTSGYVQNAEAMADNYNPPGFATSATLTVPFDALAAFNFAGRAEFDATQKVSA